MVFTIFFFGGGGIGQDGKIDLPDYEETASYCSLYYSLE